MRGVSHDLGRPADAGDRPGDLPGRPDRQPANPTPAPRGWCQLEECNEFRDEWNRVVNAALLFAGLNDHPAFLEINPQPG